MSAPPQVLFSRRLRLVGVILLGLLLATWVLERWYVAQVEQTVAQRQAEEMQRALARVEQNFAEMQADLQAHARRIAENEEVIRNLRRHHREQAPEAREALFRLFTSLPRPPRTAFELYAPTPRLLAWNGFSMPLDAAPSSSRFLEDVQTAIARDGDKRAALVIWWPVKEGHKVLGVVRAMRLIWYDAPVRNRYLRDYSLEDEWRRAVRLPVHVVLGAEAMAQRAEEGGPSRMLQGLDGTPLARVYVDPPLPEQLLEEAQARFHDLMALWAALLGCWLMVVLWRWYRQAWPPGENLGLSSQVLGRFLVVALGWWGLRYGLLALDVPARWQPGKAPLAPLFDPQHLASTLGGGVMRSIGDLMLTGLFALLFAFAVLHLALRIPSEGLHRHRLKDRLRARHIARDTVRLFGVAALTVLLVGTLVMGLETMLRHAILDSTLDYFSRTGLLPDQLVLLVYCSLLLLTLSVVLTTVGLMRGGLGVLERMGLTVGTWRSWASALVPALVVPLLALMLVWDVHAPAPWLALGGVLIVGGVGVLLQVRGIQVRQVLMLRNVLPQVFILALLLYPLLYHGLDVQRRIRMEDAAEVFREGNDPRFFFAIEQVLERATKPAVAEAMAVLEDERASRLLDSLASSLMEGSLLASLGGHEVSLTLFDAHRRPRGRYYAGRQDLGRTLLDQVDSLELDLLHAMYREAGKEGPYLDKVTGRHQRDRFQYIGIAPIRRDAGTPPVGWVLVRAEPQLQLREGHQPFPQVLLPAGAYGNTYADFSLAEFRDGVLVRSQGRNFGRYRLAEEVQQALVSRPSLWRVESVEEQRYLTYYARVDDPEERGGPGGASHVVAVRTASINLFDHLYFLLRLTMAGLFIGLPIYLIGLWWRWRAGHLPARRVAFRDKVLNAFFAVGIITASAMGYAGLKVVTGENERAIQSWLQQHLERVEATLARQARGDELPYRVLDRTRIDSLAQQVGLDLNVYKDTRLVASSRPQLVLDRLIDERLPAPAYLSLYFDGFRFTSTDEEVGSFAYTAGYRALPDERGVPRYVISVPTLPEQERIEEERARTVAYLFGSLLVLVLVVVLTAGLLANALSRPIARLREGLEAVARGRFERIPPVKTRDEIGELVETFNAMQAQLSESRQRLAQQERQLAWREMARQVAHEIKNPLTPMKLSVQHLQRAFEDLVRNGRAKQEAGLERFGQLLQYKAGTLLEQIDALKRIADEFSSFARMPTRMLEPLDLNAVIREAVALMQEEADFSIELDLSATPLVLEADREELRRIYINLIKNALQAIPEGRPPRVEITTERQPGGGGVPGWAYSTITDTGTGIPEALHSRIFEPNFSTKTSGTGLGLAIVKKGVEDLRGEIGFETETGVGTTFWIRLPLKE